MRILFAFENALPNNEADAEVFVTTARYLARLAPGSWLHVPLPADADVPAVQELAGMAVVRARAPEGPALLRHLCCGLTLVFRREFRQADLIYTRNLWIASVALAFGQRVAFDHYRPWPDQIPPLQFWLYRLFSRSRLLINICHSDYTLQKYLRLGVPAPKLQCIHNGFEPDRLRRPLGVAAAKHRIGVAPTQKTVVYTGRLNHKKGLDLVIAAARHLPDVLFILVGSQGTGPIETASRAIGNIRIVPWQAPGALAPYIFAADVLLIPPSSRPLAQFGSTVLPLKLFLYMASGRPIVAGDTPDVAEVLRHNENAWLCPADQAQALVAALRSLLHDPGLASRLADAALAESRGLTWSGRARKIIGLLDQRLRHHPPDAGHWGAVQTRLWRRESWLWLRHLVRQRSWVLPPHAYRIAGSG